MRGKSSGTEIPPLNTTEPIRRTALN
ncbi:hypothetical protein CISIN_1g0416292mg, partial [Citrus sinensis]